MRNEILTCGNSTLGTKCFANSETHEYVINSNSKRKLNFIRFARPNFVPRFAKKF